MIAVWHIYHKFILSSIKIRSNFTISYLSADVKKQCFHTIHHLCGFFHSHPPPPPPPPPPFVVFLHFFFGGLGWGFTDHYNCARANATLQKTVPASSWYLTTKFFFFLFLTKPGSFWLLVNSLDCKSSGHGSTPGCDGCSMWTLAQVP